jgi:hypothetical protein
MLWFYQEIAPNNFDKHSVVIIRATSLERDAAKIWSTHSDTDRYHCYRYFRTIYSQKQWENTIDGKLSSADNKLSRGYIAVVLFYASWSKPAKGPSLLSLPSKSVRVSRGRANEQPQEKFCWQQTAQHKARLVGNDDAIDCRYVGVSSDKIKWLIGLCGRQEMDATLGAFMLTSLLAHKYGKLKVIKPLVLHCPRENSYTMKRKRTIKTMNK